MSFPDHRSELGSGNANPVHVEAFLSWAERHRILTIGQLTTDLLIDVEPEQWLGGILRFVSYRETGQILRTWSTGHPLMAMLVRLSDGLSVDFPSIRVPEPSPQIHRQFERVERNYIAAHFATRRPTGRSHECRRRFNIDHPCRLNFDQGLKPTV